MSSLFADSAERKVGGTAHCARMRKRFLDGVTTPASPLLSETRCVRRRSALRALAAYFAEMTPAKASGGRTAPQIPIHLDHDAYPNS